jgi:hypothetical protein
MSAAALPHPRPARRPVRRCQLRSSGAVFALKQMCKADIVSMGQVLKPIPPHRPAAPKQRRCAHTLHHPRKAEPTTRCSSPPLPPRGRAGGAHHAGDAPPLVHLAPVRHQQVRRHRHAGQPHSHHGVLPGRRPLRPAVQEEEVWRRRHARLRLAGTHAPRSPLPRRPTPAARAAPTPRCTFAACPRRNEAQALWKPWPGPRDRLALPPRHPPTAARNAPPPPRTMRRCCCRSSTCTRSASCTAT